MSRAKSPIEYVIGTQRGEERAKWAHREHSEPLAKQYLAEGAKKSDESVRRNASPEKREEHSSAIVFEEFNLRIRGGRG